MKGGDSLLGLLQRHHAGDEEARDELIARLHPWLHGYVQRKMGPELRRVEASLDVVHDVLLRILDRGPAFLPQTEGQLLGLVATMAVNRLRDRYDWLLVRREASEGVTVIGHSATSPSGRAAHSEELGCLTLALALLDPEEARLLHERRWEELDHAELGRRRGISADAARMRCNAAQRRLGRLVKQLETGELTDLPTDLPPFPPPVDSA